MHTCTSAHSAHLTLALSTAASRSRTQISPSTFRPLHRASRIYRAAVSSPCKLRHAGRTGLIRAEAQSDAPRAAEKSRIQTGGDYVVNLRARVPAARAALNVPPGRAAAEGTTLLDYMRYGVRISSMEMPFGAACSRVGAGRYSFTMPRVELFDVWLQPTADTGAAIDQETGEILLTSESARLTGSSHVTDLGLNERYECSTRISFRPEGEREIGGQAELLVSVDVPAPFNIIPKPVLEATASAALQVVLDFLMSEFVRMLARDFDGWAQNSAERERRKLEPI